MNQDWKKVSCSALQLCFHSKFVLVLNMFLCSCFCSPPPFYLLYPKQGSDFFSSCHDYIQSPLPGYQKLVDNSSRAYKLTAVCLLSWGRWKANPWAAKNHTQAEMQYWESWSLLSIQETDVTLGWVHGVTPRPWWRPPSPCALMGNRGGIKL